MPKQYPSPTSVYHNKVYPAIDPTRPELSLKDASAVVTGAGTGIGAVIASSFAIAGVSKLALVGRTEKTLRQTKAIVERTNSETQSFVITADVTNLECIADGLRLFADAVGGRIDVLVANHGYMPSPTSIADADPGEWRTGFDINVMGNLNLLKAFTPLAAPNARVVHVSSGTMHLPPIAASGCYASSKIAAAKLFEYYAFEHPRKSVVQFHPGLIHTDILEKAQADSAGATDSWSDDNIPDIISGKRW